MHFLKHYASLNEHCERSMGLNALERSVYVSSVESYGALDSFEVSPEPAK